MVITDSFDIKNYTPLLIVSQYLKEQQGEVDTALLSTLDMTASPPKASPWRRYWVHTHLHAAQIKAGTGCKPQCRPHARHPRWVHTFLNMNSMEYQILS